MDNNKYLIDTVIEQAKIHNMELLREYERKLQNYPRGSIVIREMNGRKYCYFRYRDGKKIITKYAGTEGKLEELKQLVVEREKINEEIKRIKAEMERIERIEAVK